jgi:hypothetical protein
MWSDPIADMLTRIRNAVRVRKKVVEVPASKVKAGIANVLRDEGYIRGYDKIDDTKQGILRIELKVRADGRGPDSHDQARVASGLPGLSRLRESPAGPRRIGYCHRLDQRGRDERPAMSREEGRWRVAV